MDVQEDVNNYISNLTAVASRLPKDLIEQVIETLYQAYQDGKTIYTMGNGGHGSTAAHFINDLSKHTVVSDQKDRVVVKGKRLKAMSLNDSISTLTGWANDMGYEHVFSKPLAGWVEKGDVVIGFSGSGNSPNVLEAFAVARAQGATTICLSGFDGGLAKDRADICLVVPSQNMLIIEDLHLVICHLITAILRSRIQRRDWQAG